MQFPDRSLSIATATTTLPRLLALGVLIACSGGSDKVTGTPNPPPATATVVMSGTIVAGTSRTPVPSALIEIGGVSTTTGTDGTYSLSGVRTGAGKLRVTANRYDSYEQDIMVPASNFTRDVLIQRTERFNLPGNFAIYVPASVTTVRTVIIALGGPDTRGFVNGFILGQPGAPNDPAAVGALNQLTGSLQAFAVTGRVAILGTLPSRPDSPDTDELLLTALRDAAEATGHPELTTVPFLLYGFSGGGPETAGFAIRYANRTAGLFLAIPDPAPALESASIATFPSYALLAEKDEAVDNGITTQLFAGLRAAGAPAALAVERNVFHLTPKSAAQQSLTISWMSAILQLRLSGNAASPLNPVDLTTGWLGNPQSQTIAPWSSYSGEKLRANWFPSQQTAAQWQAFIQ